MSKKILIIGNSAKEYALAKVLSKNNEVFVAPGCDTIKDFATCVDIREDSISELLEFVLENGIDITIPLSVKAINSNISEDEYITQQLALAKEAREKLIAIFKD